MSRRTIRTILFAAAIALSSCTQTPQAERGAPLPTAPLPPMKTFAGPHVEGPRRANALIANDILDLTFRLESGRTLPVFTRFEGPVTVRVAGRSTGKPRPGP